MAIFGAPLPLPEPELAAVRAALDMQEMIEMFNHERVALEKEPIRTGIGIASGEVVAGYTGTQQRVQLRFHRCKLLPQGRDRGGALCLEHSKIRFCCGKTLLRRFILDR